MRIGDRKVRRQTEKALTALDQPKVQSPNPNKRFEAELTARDLREEMRLANRPGGFGYHVLESFHENLSDEIFKRRFSKAWLLTNPYRVKSIRDSYLLALFDTYRNRPSPLLTQSPSPFREVASVEGKRILAQGSRQEHNSIFPRIELMAPHRLVTIM